MLVRLPMVMLLTSPRITAEGQTEESSPMRDIADDRGHFVNVGGSGYRRCDTLKSSDHDKNSSLLLLKLFAASQAASDGRT